MRWLDYSSVKMKTVANSEPDGSMALDQAVWVDSARMSGTLCFRSSRLPVQQLFDWLADGVSLDEFVCEFQVDRDTAITVLRYAGSSIFTSPASLPGDQRSDVSA